MKRVLTTVIFFSLALTASAQFFQGFGLMGGLTLGRQKWWITEINSADQSKTESTFKTKRILRFNGEIFAEFGKHPNFHWRTEFQYNQKGSIEKTSADKFKNKLDYICWNNFLIIRQEDFLGTPYFLIGPRVEYKFKQGLQSPLLLNDDFQSLHFSWSVGLGWEFVTYGRFKPFVEIHYNPDLNKASTQSDPVLPEIISATTVKNRAWELRIGFKIVRNPTKCPAVYK